MKHLTFRETKVAISNSKRCTECGYCLYVIKYEVDHKIRRIKFMAHYLSQSVSWGETQGYVTKQDSSPKAQKDHIILRWFNPAMQVLSI